MMAQMGQLNRKKRMPDIFLKSFEVKSVIQWNFRNVIFITGSNIKPNLSDADIRINTADFRSGYGQNAKQVYAKYRTSNYSAYKQPISMNFWGMLVLVFEK